MKSKPIPGGFRDVASALDPWVLKAPDHEALVSRFARYTYQQLDAAVNAGAAALSSLGVRPQARPIKSKSS